MGLCEKNRFSPMHILVVAKYTSSFFFFPTYYVVSQLQIRDSQTSWKHFRQNVYMDKQSG